MNDSRRRILSMLSEGKISIEEAERLLAALGQPNERVEEDKTLNAYKKKPKPRYLRIVAREASGEQVDIKVPLGLIRAGVKLGSVMPSETRKQISASLSEQGIDFDLDNLNADNVENLIEQLTELEVNVGGGEDTVRIFCE